MNFIFILHILKEIKLLNDKTLNDTLLNNKTLNDKLDQKKN